MSTKAVVVFGVDQGNTTCLIQALNLYDEVHCVTFDYGQRRRAEIDVARQLAQTLGVTAHRVLDVTLRNESPIRSLTRDTPVHGCGAAPGTLPSTFVPGRNLLFLTWAAIYAYQVSANAVISGV